MHTNKSPWRWHYFASFFSHFRCSRTRRSNTSNTHSRRAARVGQCALPCRGQSCGSSIILFVFLHSWRHSDPISSPCTSTAFSFVTLYYSTFDSVWAFYLCTILFSPLLFLSCSIMKKLLSNTRALWMQPSIHCSITSSLIYLSPHPNISISSFSPENLSWLHHLPIICWLFGYFCKGICVLPLN